MLRDFISLPSRRRGWYEKYVMFKKDAFGNLTPTDPEAIYFPLRLDTDARAREAAGMYAKLIEGINPELANDIREWVKVGEEIHIRNSGYV